MANKKSTNAKGSGSRKKKKKSSSDDTIKFFMVLVIAGIAITMIFFMQDKGEDVPGIGTPTPGINTEIPGPTGTQDTPVPTPTNVPTKKPTEVPTKVPAESTKAPTQAPQETLTPEPTPTEEPEPTALPAGLSAESAENLVAASISSNYRVQLINDHLNVNGAVYYQFCAMSGNTMLYPFLVVDKTEGTMYCYDSTENTIFEFTTFPLEQPADPEVTPEPAEQKVISAEEAYAVLCEYSKESLNIAKDVVNYDAEYGSELTLVNGINCYRINLSEVSENGKVRNKGEFYISVDGTKCYYIDSETNEFVLVQK